VALRLIEAVVRSDQADTAREICQGDDVLGVWSYDFDDEHSGVRVLLDARATEEILDRLSNRFEGQEGFRALVLRLEAVLPPPEAKEEESPPEKPEPRYGRSRLSRAELYSQAQEGAELNWVFFTMVLLSTVVALVGLDRNDVAVVVGAMVLAPLLGPNVSLAMATTLGDKKLAAGAFRKSASGMALALALSVAAGAWFPIDLASPAILARTQAALPDLALACAAGVAGGIAFTTGVPASLIGVMVAVALLPPAVVLGVTTGSREWSMASGAALLLAVNVVCVNLTAVATFAAQGIYPRRWWEADQARRATRRALIGWTILLLALVALVAQLPGS
jgi:uncharacterized hydrophobic protein (TIGR00341 family)